MKELVFSDKGKAVTSSRLVAEKCGKRHFDVIKSIEKIDASEDFTERKISFSNYKNVTGRTLPEYLMTRDGFAFLVMGFICKKAAKFKEEFIAEFNRRNFALISTLFFSLHNFMKSGCFTFMK